MSYNYGSMDLLHMMYVKQIFRVHAAILWTISNFPASAILKGWSTKGQISCPSCNKETCFYRLQHGRKFCYMGHRQFLPTNDKFRRDKRSFNSEEELRLPPTRTNSSWECTKEKTGKCYMSAQSEERVFVSITILENTHVNVII